MPVMTMVDNGTTSELTELLEAVISQVEEREKPDGLTTRDLQELELLRGIQSAVKRGELIEWTPDASE